MATLISSNRVHVSYVKLEPEMTITYPALSTEWAILQALRSHHQRLERKTRYRPLRRPLQDIGSVKWQNDVALFDTHLRHILTKGDLDTIVKHKLKEQEQNAQSHIVSICTLLNRLANSLLLSDFSEGVDPKEKDNRYPRLLLLAQILNDTKWDFDLTTGQGRVLFVLESEQDADEAKSVVRTFDEFFSQAMMLPMSAKKVEQPTSEVRESRHQLRDRAVEGLESLFLHVPQGQSQVCEGHRILTKLPDWDTIDKQSNPETTLELFFSTCASSNKWHKAKCAVRSSSASDDEDLRDFCGELRYANTSGNVFRFLARDKNLFMSSNDDEERLTKPNSQPTKSLYDLIENQNFCESRNINPLMPLIKAQRFNEKQRRALASRLALSLSLFLNSDYVLNASEASTVFFVIENGRCELDLGYATSTVNNHDKNTAFNESMSLYDNLARILLEIEYGVSLKSLALGKVKAWVDNRLILDNEELGSDFYHDAVNIKDIEARTSYLTAVRDLLNFKKTYRKGSRRLKGRLFDIGAIAGEVLFSDVAERLRSCIEPTQLQISGLESSKEEFLFQTLDNEIMRKTKERKVVMRSAVRTTAFKNKATPIQLFDDKDEFEEDKGLATKADFFFSQLEEFHESCEERAASIQSCSHKPVRIAVLDTGINRTSGAIKGGLRTHRIQLQNCRSWVGNDPNDVHDYDGHGTRIAELILRAAPEADVYVCKVFNGRSLQPDEVKGIAKAITYAVDVWDVDIISMSFGLTSDSLINDTSLKDAYKDIDVAIENAKSKIFFAAAANHGSHGPRTFPAKHDSVICIHASDGKGKDGGISPDPESTDDNFMTLGIALDFGDKRKSGTSYAAPMAASMAAYILYIAENLLDLPQTAIDRLRTGRGMREMFRLMCGPSCPGGYRFVAPWVKLWTKDWYLDDDKIKFIETTVRTTDMFKF